MDLPGLSRCKRNRHGAQPVQWFEGSQPHHRMCRFAGRFFASVGRVAFHACVLRALLVTIASTRRSFWKRSTQIDLGPKDANFESASDRRFSLLCSSQGERPQIRQLDLPTLSGMLPKVLQEMAGACTN